ncbi:MAG: secretin and TonB N-terminal domain-containing protein, partial [Deltaproteobacteria bacterium]|nr:secretin and TonB N-terminal domain-containing protein [Deltaproteobacteria bacterium]
VKPAPAAAPAPAKRVAIKNVSFDHDSATSQVVIDLGGDIAPEIVSTTDRRAELILDGVDLPTRLERTLDTSRVGGPIKAISAFRDPAMPSRVRVVVDLSEPAAPRLAHSGNTWRWQFAGTATASRGSTARAIPTPVVAGYGASSTPVAQTSVGQVAGAVPSGKRKIYHGATMDLATKDASIHDLLSAISDVARVNIVIPDDINARVTVRLKRVPWDQALEVILASKGLWYRREGNLIRVAPRKQLDAEDEAEAARRAAERDREAPEPEVLTLNYASASELQNKLTPMLSPKGKIEVDERTNSVIINDLRANRRRIQQLARRSARSAATSTSTCGSRPSRTRARSASSRRRASRCSTTSRPRSARACASRSRSCRPRVRRPSSCRPSSASWSSPTSRSATARSRWTCTSPRTSLTS